ncbi:MAG TPA: hypothetical protein VGI60_11735 [Chthoniobacterales bacterium]
MLAQDFAGQSLFSGNRARRRHALIQTHPEQRIILSSESYPSTDLAYQEAVMSAAANLLLVALVISIFNGYSTSKTISHLSQMVDAVRQIQVLSLITTV